jgi:hypothetical protein
MPVILALGRLRQEDHEFEASQAKKENNEIKIVEIKKEIY